MSQQAYINQILEPIIKTYIEDKEDFVLEEERNLGHKPDESNIVKTWK